MISQRFSSKQGMTLVEIMVVLAIISMVFGVSSAFFTQFNKRLAVQGAAFQVRNILRTCKNYATESKNKNTIKINKSIILLTGTNLIAYWHLESINKNAESIGFGNNILIQDGKIIAGKIGNAISLSSNAFIDCGSIQNIGLNHGFVVSAWVYFDSVKNSNRNIFSLGANGKLEITSDRKLLFTWGGETLIAKKRISFLEWTHLKIKCDGNSVWFYVNNLETDNKKFSEFIPIIDYQAHLQFAENAKFSIDEIVIESLVELRKYELPENMQFSKYSSPILFNETGKLDPLYHEGEANILITEATKEFNVSVSLMGNITVSEITTE